MPRFLPERSLYNREGEKVKESVLTGELSRLRPGTGISHGTQGRRTGEQSQPGTGCFHSGRQEPRSWMVPTARPAPPDSPGLPRGVLMLSLAKRWAACRRRPSHVVRNSLSARRRTGAGGSCRCPQLGCAAGHRGPEASGFYAPTNQECKLYRNHRCLS